MTEQNTVSGAGALMAADLPLGKSISYPTEYTPDALRPIPRAPARLARGGADYWTAHEFTWLSAAGCPRVAQLRLCVPFDSPSIVESKSLKLFLMSFAFERWASRPVLVREVARQLSAICGAEVRVELWELGEVVFATEADLGDCLDGLASAWTADAGERALAGLRVPSGGRMARRWHSHLFHSLCPVTGQPDLATVLIDYDGPALDGAALVAYLTSYRRTALFHEAAIDRIYDDIALRTQPTRLQVSGLFCRRGGIDIVPVRASDEGSAWPPRLARQ